MKKVFSTLLSVLVIASFLLTGCGGGKPAAKVVTLTYPQEFDSLSPLYSRHVVFLDHLADVRTLAVGIR